MSLVEELIVENTPKLWKIGYFHIQGEHFYELFDVCIAM